MYLSLHLLDGPVTLNNKLCGRKYRYVRAPDISGAVAMKSSLIVTGPITINNSAVLKNNLDVSGDTTLNYLTVKKSSVFETGIISKKSDISGATTLNDDLTVFGSVDFKNGLSVRRIISGAVQVSGITSLESTWMLKKVLPSQNHY